MPKSTARACIALFALLGPVLAWSAPWGLANLAHRPLDLGEAIVGAATLAAITGYGWLALGAGLTVAASSGSRLARWMAELLVPEVWRRTVSIATGCAVSALPAAGGLLGTSAATASAEDDRSGESAAGQLVLPMPDRPVEGAPQRWGVVVRPGDSLWWIAAQELGPGATESQVSSRWPQWYRANRDQIGADPDFILPGIVLRAPTGSAPLPGGGR